jgi:hypothetical protein
MAYVITFTLDDLSNTHIMESKLIPTGRLDGIDFQIRKGFLLVLAQYLLDRGPCTFTNPFSKFEYTVRDSDIQHVVDMFKQGLPESPISF